MAILSAPKNIPAIKFTLAIIIMLGVIFLIINHEPRYKIIAMHDTNFGQIWVYEERTKRCLSFENPPAHLYQSCYSLQNPQHLLHEYNKAFLSTLFLKSTPNKILVIGLAGASIQKALNTLLPETAIDTVEINPTLPKVAQQYFGYKTNAQNRILIEDGAAFIHNAKANNYDIILLDAFDADYIPPQFLTQEFMDDVKRILTPTGIVAINTFTDSKFSTLESELFSNTFGTYYNLIPSMNRIMVASNSPLASPEQIQINSSMWTEQFTELGINTETVSKLYTH